MAVNLPVYSSQSVTRSLTTLAVGTSGGEGSTPVCGPHPATMAATSMHASSLFTATPPLTPSDQNRRAAAIGPRCRRPLAARPTGSEDPPDPGAEKAARASLRLCNHGARLVGHVRRREFELLRDLPLDEHACLPADVPRLRTQRARNRRER